MSGERYFFTSFRIHSISSSGGAGLLRGSHLRSVVPTMVWFCQGKKKRKRPSEVLMSSKPIVGVEKYPGRTM